MDRLALLGGSPVHERPWPRWPIWDAGDEAVLLEALGRGEWGGFPMPNHYAGRFAATFAHHHDCAFGQCVVNGTVSLELALQAMRVEPGAEVIVPAYTFEATAAAVLFAGCVPVFADIDDATYCLDPASVEARLTERTQAVLPVHLGMRMADVDRLTEICRKHGLALLEDCAHAHGARWRDRGAGSFGAAGSFSFQTTKLMAAGEGGIVVTNDEAILDRLFALVNCGRQRPERLQDHSVIGHNYRMTDLQAALLETQLSRLDEQHHKRNDNASHLDNLLQEVEGLVPLARDERLTHPAVYQYVLRYDASRFEDLPREAVVAALNAEGIPCDGRFYECLTYSELLPHDPARYPEWSAREQARCPNAERAAWDEAIWIPHQVLLDEAAEMIRLPEALEKIRRNADRLRDLKHPAIEEQRVVRGVRE